MKRITLFLTVVALSLTASAAQAVDNNLQFSGTLVSEPCELDPQTTDLRVDFKSIVEKDLYLNTRTRSEAFTINLLGCDTTQGNLATLTFRGTESTALPGKLAVDNTTAGIAIGLENQDGSPLTLNQPSPEMTLAQGTNSLTFQAYVMGEPEAIQKQSIAPGEFTATATFEITYP